MITFFNTHWESSISAPGCLLRASSEPGGRCLAFDLPSFGHRRRLHWKSLHTMRIAYRQLIKCMASITSIDASSGIGWCSFCKGLLGCVEEMIMKVLEHASCKDQLNIPVLASFEALIRRAQLVEQAHAFNPSHPDYSNSTHASSTFR